MSALASVRRSTCETERGAGERVKADGSQRASISSGCAKKEAGREGGLTSSASAARIRLSLSSTIARNGGPSAAISAPRLWKPPRASATRRVCVRRGGRERGGGKGRQLVRLVREGESLKVDDREGGSGRTSPSDSPTADRSAPSCSTSPLLTPFACPPTAASTTPLARVTSSRNAPCSACARSRYFSTWAVEVPKAEEPVAMAEEVARWCWCGRGCRGETGQCERGAEVGVDKGEADAPLPAAAGARRPRARPRRARPAGPPRSRRRARRARRPRRACGRRASRLRWRWRRGRPSCGLQMGLG